MTETLKRRRSLSNVGGTIDRGGDEPASALLAHALEVEAQREADAPDRAHVHGFHAYPARAHPVTVRRLVEAFAPLVSPSEVPSRPVVFDPFCGSGTVLVEAMLAGCNALGADLNPLAAMLARAKTHPRKPEALAALLACARAVAQFADERRVKKLGATRRIAQADVSLFAPHVLLELDGLRAGIEHAPPEARPDLQLVLSSILVKLSAKRGDTSDEPLEKRVSAGYPARLLSAKPKSFWLVLSHFQRFCPPNSLVRARVVLDDACRLDKIDAASVDVVITSPPYVATYDYLAHHDMRLRWLDLDSRRLADNEVGARRHYERKSPEQARSAWELELATFFRALARVTKPGAPVVLLIADSATPVHSGRSERSVPLRADDIVAETVRNGVPF